MLIFGLATLIALIALSLWSFRWGLLLYLAVGLMFPVLWIGPIAVRLELVYCLWLVFLFFVRKIAIGTDFQVVSSKFQVRSSKNPELRTKNYEPRTNQWHPILSCYALFLTAMVFSTLLLLLARSSSAISRQSLIPFYGFLRPLLIMLLFRNSQFNERWLHRLLVTFVVLSIPISVLSICQTGGFGFAQDLTQRWYTSPWRTSIPVVKSQWGFILRNTGVFEYHGYNATFSLTAILIAGYLLIKIKGGKRKLALLYPSLTLATIAGLFSVSVTFLLGGIILLFLLTLSSRTSPRGLLKFTTNAAVVIGVSLLLAAPLILKSPDIRQGLRNQIGRIIDGDFLRGRYDAPAAGKLAPTYKAITQRLIFGWGFKEGVFSGDSLYVSLLYRGGIIGLGLWFFFITTILTFALRHPALSTRLTFLLTILYLVVGLGNPSFFIPRLGEWYWALIGLSINAFRVVPPLPRKLRVLHIIPDLREGGAERLVMNLLGAFDRNQLGVAVVSLYPESRTFFERKTKQQGLKVFFLNKHPGPDPLIIFRLYRHFKAFSPDVVHTHLYVLPYALIPTLLCRVPVRLHTVHNVAQMEVEGWRKLFHWVAFRFARFIPVAVCDYVAKTVQAVYGITPPVIYNGIFLENFPLQPSATTKNREEVVLLHIGRFVPQKNHLLLLEAFSLVVKEAERTLLWLVGDGPLRLRVERKAKELGLRDKVRFLGLREDIPQLMAESDIFVLSSDWEGAPLTVLEAMASAKPIVATAVGGVPELVEDGKTGVLVPSGNAEALSQTILHLIRNRNFRQTMGEFARKRALEQFSITNTARGYEGLYIFRDRSPLTVRRKTEV